LLSYRDPSTPPGNLGEYVLPGLDEHFDGDIDDGEKVVNVKFGRFPRICVIIQTGIKVFKSLL
jgi:hypothetical protein